MSSEDYAFEAVMNGEWSFVMDDEPDNPCTLCHGEGAIGSGYSNSFVDALDAIPCPRCEGTGQESGS